MKLLVSVRSAEEAVLAMAGGADILDVKEPLRGALGAASMSTFEKVVTANTQRLPVSVACGELRDAGSFAFAQLPVGVSFAKLGLAGSRQDAWCAKLARTWAHLPSHVQPVAVAYADWHAAGAPPPDEVIRRTRGTAKFFLLDTFSKTGSLRDRWPTALVARWLELARGAGFRTVLAGSLQAHDLGHVARHWRPDVVGVRRAACLGSRDAPICVNQVSRLKRALCREAHGTQHSIQPAVV